MMRHKHVTAGLCLFLLAAIFTAPALAQEKTAMPAAAGAIDVTAEMAQETLPVDKGPFRESFFFTPAEVASILRALAGQTTGTAALSSTTAERPAEPIPVKRTITLSGVFYKAPDNWIIWMNGQKLTPARLLPEIQEIKVSRETVQLKWFDIGLNDTIAITLRPHQTYDIVTGLLLPGSGG